MQCLITEQRASSTLISECKGKETYSSLQAGLRSLRTIVLKKFGPGLKCQNSQIFRPLAHLILQMAKSTIFGINFRPQLPLKHYGFKKQQHIGNIKRALGAQIICLNTDMDMVLSKYEEFHRNMSMHS